MRLDSIKRLALFTCFASVCQADSTVSDDDFFNFIKADAKKDPVAPPPVKTPTEAEAMLEKWNTYEQTCNEKQKSDTLGGRKILMEILLKKSLTATPEARSLLLAESDRINGLDFETPLVNTAGASPAMSSALLGKWTIKNLHATHDFAPTGNDVIHTGAINKWRWVDPEAGVFVSENKSKGDLYWMDRPAGAAGINQENYRFRMEKSNSPKFQTDPAVLTLNTSENSQRQIAKSELASQRQRVINWLLDKAKQMPADEMTQVVTKVHALEVQSEKQGDGTDKLKGRWTWENQEIIFQPGGIIASRSGQKVGRWGWLSGTKASFAAVFDGAKAKAKDIFLTKTPTDDSQTTFEAHRMIDGHITVTRKIP